MKKPPIGRRLALLRRNLDKLGVDALIVRSTDRYLNEYVPTDSSSRVFISGFTGSMGEVVVGPRRAYLAVDGRYWLQAEKETNPSLFEVVRVPMGTGLDQAVAGIVGRLCETTTRRRLRVGFDPAQTTPATLELLRAATPPSVVWRALSPSPVEALRGAVAPARPPQLRVIDPRRTGASTKERLADLGGRLEDLDVQAIFLQRLDEIAYLANLRGDELPYQSTFRAMALATRDRLYVGMDTEVSDEVRAARPEISFVPEKALWDLMGRGTRRRRIGCDPRGNTEEVRVRIEATGASASSVASPVATMKAVKGGVELKTMQDALQRADRVVHGSIRWACRQVAAGRRVSERDLAEHVEAAFLSSGARGLSFPVISAAGKNGAIIHYSEPSARRAIREGELVLLDTGAYYEEGYATDLTRTFLAGGNAARATDEQKRYYTLVLKGAIAGMNAVVPVGASGAAIDALVRAPLWRAGLDYAHGTGHGIGVLVHEFPPRIAPSGASALEAGYVFSIEPGVYLPSFGGIRIENLCTLVPAKSDGFLRVKPLSFCPLDRRLIEPSLLSRTERAWLAAYRRVYASSR